MLNKAFSLIELMIVITIIGILAAVAVPSYQDYIVKTKIAATLPTLEAFKKAVTETYMQTGAFPTIFNYGGSSFNAGAGGGAAYSAGSVVRMSYSFFNTNEDALVCVYILDLNHGSGYVAPTGTTWGEKSQLCMTVEPSASAITTKCGQAYGDANLYDIPNRFLPASCKCTSVVNGTC